MTSTVEKAEIRLTRRLARFRDHPAVEAMEPVSKLADQPPMLALSGGVLAVGLITGRRRVAEAGARMLAAVLLATAIKTGVKAAVSRTRPHVTLDGGGYASEAGGSDDKGEQSFPSGHTADAVAAAAALTRAMPRAWPLGWSFAAAVAALQPAKARHFPTDVAAGAAIGLAAEAIVSLVGQRLSTLISPLRSR